MANATNTERFAYDAYRRLINMFGDVVMGVDHREFEQEFDKIKGKHQVRLDTDVPTEGLIQLCQAYKRVYRKYAGEDFPQDPMSQLQLAIEAVFSSWNTTRAVRYREVENIRGLLGTAVNVQSMVYGNMGEDSGTGVAFTRDPSTGENEFYGEFLINAQGEDVVAGIRTPEPVANMAKWNRRVHKQLPGDQDDSRRPLPGTCRTSNLRSNAETVHVADSLRQTDGRGRGARGMRDGAREVDRGAGGDQASSGQRLDAVAASQL